MAECPTWWLGLLRLGVSWGWLLAPGPVPWGHSGQWPAGLGSCIRSGHGWDHVFIDVAVRLNDGGRRGWFDRWRTSRGRAWVDADIIWVPVIAKGAVGLFAPLVVPWGPPTSSTPRALGPPTVALVLITEIFILNFVVIMGHTLFGTTVVLVAYIAVSAIVSISFRGIVVNLVALRRLEIVLKLTPSARATAASTASSARNHRMKQMPHKIGVKWLHLTFHGLCPDA